MMFDIEEGRDISHLGAFKPQFGLWGIDYDYTKLITVHVHDAYIHIMIVCGRRKQAGLHTHYMCILQYYYAS